MIQSTTHNPVASTSAIATSTMMLSPKPQYQQRADVSTPSSHSSKQTVNSHSGLANKAIGEGNYLEALEQYKLALDEYTKGTPTVVELVNAAATCFNLGALSKKLQNFREAAEYFCQAENLYKSCSAKLREVSASDPHSGGKESSCDVCLYRLIAETLQARAHLHYKYQSWLDQAIECHEEVVEVLAQQLQEDKEMVYYKVHFISLSRDDRSQLMVTSLQALGKFYVERGEFEDGLMAYQEALTTLKEQDSEESPTKHRQEEVSHIIKALSDIFIKSSDASSRVPQLQKLAKMQEDSGNWDMALSCWERVLYLQSQEDGEMSSTVANTLCQIARVMVAQGNREGALDLYQAAAAKYQQTKTPIPRHVIGSATDIFYQLDLQDDALDWLDNLMDVASDAGERASILCQRGRIFLEQGRLYEADSALIESAETYEFDDDYVYKLLQKLEFLQQKSNVLNSPNAEMPLESIQEGDENSTVVTLELKTGQQKSATKAVSHDSELVLKSEDPPAPRIDEQRSEESSTPTIDEMASPRADLAPAGDLDSSNISPAISQVEEIRAVSPEDSAGLDESVLEASLHGAADGSKSTEETEQSIDSGTDHNRGGETTPDASKVDEISSSSADHDDIQDLSIDESDSESGLYFRGSNLQEDEDEDFSPSASPSVPVASFAVETRVASPATEVETRVPVTEESEAIAALSVQPQRHLSAEQDDASEEDSTFNFPNDTLDILPLESVTSESEPLVTPRKDRKSKSSSPTQSLRIPTLASPRNQKSRERREYTEITDSSKPASKSRIVQALSNPFRRSRGKRPLGGVLDALDENRELKGSLPAVSTNMVIHDFDDEISASAADAPVAIIAADDDDQSQVSQITFKWEEHAPQRSNQEGQWWWGVTAEGLEGWFPSSYVNQAVQAAEGFLSAKSIHERVKSRPLDFDSDEESEVEPEEVSFTKTRERSTLTVPEVEKLEMLKKPEEFTRMISMGSSVRPSGMSEAASQIVSSRSVGTTKKLTLSNRIEEKKELLEKQQLVDGPEHISVASILFELALLQASNGEIVEALENGQQALKIQKATLNLAAASKTLHFMADVHTRENQYRSALSCYSEAQGLQEAVFGHFHEETANTLNRIGNVLARQGEFDMAMENHKEALRILKECCGEEVKNPLVCQTLIQIGAVYYKERNSLATIQANRDAYSTFIEGGMLEVIGRAHEERGSYRMAIAFFEEKLQFLNIDEDPDDLEQIAETLNSLGMLSCRAGLFLEAIDYYDRALGIQMKLGCDNVQLAMARVLAGSVQYSLGHYNKALNLFEGALVTLKKEIGLEQETVAATRFHMGVVRVALCDYENAMSDLQSAMKTQKRLLGNEHPATLRTRREIGNLFTIYESELDAALHEYTAVLEIQKRIHSEKHPNVAETLHSIGCAQARKGDIMLALRTLEGCYNMRVEFLGLDHPMQATTLHEIAKIQLKRGRVKKAMHICDSALHIRKECLSENHIDVGTLLSTKGSCLVAKGNFVEASKVFQEALKIVKEAVGASHPSVADIQVQLGIMHLQKCHFDEASAAISEALTIYRGADLDEDHPGIKEALVQQERIERAEMLCV